jgi:sugar transferase (PEP-CTERM/EpsH1 system associated)
MAPEKRITLIHVVLSLDVGGLENGVVNLVNELNSERFASVICCIKHAGELASRLRGSIPVYELGHYGGYEVGVIGRLARIMKQERVDLVHTRNLKPYFLGFSAAKLAMIPAVVHSEHGRDFPFEKHQMLAQRICSAFTNKVIVLSEDLRRSLVEHVKVSDQRITTILNGVDTNRFSPEAKCEKKRALGLSEQDIVIGSVGRLVPVKNYGELLNAFARLVHKDIPLKLVIAGDGPDAPTLKETARRLGVESSVQWLGTRDDIPEIIGAMDVFALTSKNEGISNTVLEAMACGVPVVVSRVGGNPEIVVDGRTGYLYEAGNLDELVGLIDQLVSDREHRLEKGSGARQHVLENFSIETMVRRYEQTYLEAFTGKAS